MICLALLGVTETAMARAQGKAPPGAKRPAILIIDDSRGHRGYWNPLGLQEMLDAGFEVGQCPPRKTPAWDQLKRYNVALVVSVGKDFAADLQPRLERFMNAGGGVLVVPAGTQVSNVGGHASVLRWLKGLGATAYLHGVVDPDRRAVIDWCKWPGAPAYIWTTQVADSPVTRGVKTLWYRTGASAYFMLLSSPMDLDARWTPLVMTGPNSHTVSWTESAYERDRLTPELREAYKGFIPAKGRKQGRLPLLAVRSHGRGRLAAFSMNPQDFFWTGYIPAQGGVSLRKGFKDRPSHGWKLLDNLYRWLAAPSLAGDALGGATTAGKDLFRTVPTAPRPYDWAGGAEGGLGVSLPGADPLLTGSVPDASKQAAAPTPMSVPRGLVGAHSAASTGRGTVAEWVRAAKSAGLDFLVFLEDLRHMNPQKWERLKADCEAASDKAFVAYPGFEFRHELGNRGYFINRHWRWPADPRMFTKDGRKLSTSRVYNDSTGPLNLFLGYEQPVPNVGAYTLGFFSHGTNLTPPWAHRAFGSFALFSRDPKTGIDAIADTLPVFLTLQNQKLHISPMAIALMSDPREVAGVVRRGGPFVTVLGDKGRVASAFDTGGQYCYAGRASALCATTGPSILTWNGSYTTPYVIPRWNVAKREEDFFVLDNYRYRVRLAAASPKGIAEVLIYDGDQGVYRRFLPGGRKQFEATLDLSNSQSRHLVAVITDTAGGVAVSPEIQTENWLNRHYLCSDRCNFGTGHEGQGAWYPHPGPYTDQQGPETMLVIRWSRPVISADVTALRLNLDTRFETAGASSYAYGNPWHCYYRTWPMEEMRIAHTTVRWRGQYGGDIFFLEEYFPAAIDTIWNFPKPDQPFYPANRWPKDPDAAKRTNWKPTQHTMTEVTLTDDVTLRRPFVDALDVTKVYVPGKGAFDFRIDGKRLTGTLPGKGQPALERTGSAPTGGLFTLTAEADKTGWSWFVTGTDLTYRLHAADGKMTLAVGRAVPDRKAKKGTVYRWEVYGLEGMPTDAALAELIRPTGLKMRVGKRLVGRIPYTFQAVKGAVGLRIDDLGGIPLEWIPLEVRGLSTQCTAYYAEVGTGRVRPVGVDPDGVARVVLWRGKRRANLFIGHPILCSNPNIRFDAVRHADGTWIIDANNSTDRDWTATFTWHSAWPGRGKLPTHAKLPKGGRLSFTFSEETRAKPNR